jgi:segregation and condensation protein A
MIFPTTNVEIKLPVFNGPLDLLLELIERAELDITRVALAQVTDQYLQYFAAIQDRRLDDLASFIVIASRLLQIKSEALLPRPPERETGEEDPGDALARQLIAYRRFKRVAKLLGRREEQKLRTYLRLAPHPVIEPRMDMSAVDLQALRLAMQEVLANHPESPSLEQAVAAPKIRLRDKIRDVLEAIKSLGRTTFRHLMVKAQSRLEVVVSFLAVLELVKQRQVRVEQESLFGDIRLLPGESWDQDQEPDFELEFDE